MRYVVLLVWGMMPALSQAETQSAGYEITGNIEFGGLKTSGNTSTSTYDGRLELTYQYQAWNVDFVFTGTQTKDAGKITSDYYNAELKSIYDLPWQLYAFGLLGYREDFFGGIYREDTSWLGLGYHVFAEDLDYKLDVEAGSGKRNTQKVNKSTVDHDAIVHYAIIAAYAWDDTSIKGQWQTEGGNDDSFITQDLSVEHKLFHNIAISFNYESRTLTAPVAGKIGEDIKTSLRFGYAF